MDGQGRLLRTPRVNLAFNKKGESEWQNEQVLSMTRQLEAVMCELKVKQNAGIRLEYGCNDCRKNETGKICNHCFHCGDTAHQRADCVQ